MLSRETNRFFLDIRSPQRFKMKDVSIMTLLCVPPGVAAGALLGAGTVGVVAVVLLRSTFPVPLAYALMPFIIALGLSLLLFYFAPLLLEVNYYVRFVVRQYAQTEAESSYVCQVSGTPRLFRGARAFLEDADDVGILNLSNDGLSFTGDHITLRVPYSSIASVTQRNIGWRGLWFVYGNRIRVNLRSGNDYQSFDFVERQSNTVTSSRRLSNTIYCTLRDRTQGA
jgi:hypothetical protein